MAKELVSEGCSEKFHKIVWKTIVMEYFLREVGDLQPEIFHNRCEIFQNSSSIKNVGVAASFSCTV